MSGKRRIKPLEVVAACIVREGQFLLCQRPEYKARGLQWEFPGGKVEKGETQPEALKRELAEELSMTVEVLDKLCDCIHEYPDLTVRLNLYRCRLLKDDFRLLEHVACRWVCLEEAEQLELCPADKLLVERLKESDVIL